MHFSNTLARVTRTRPLGHNDTKHAMPIQKSLPFEANNCICNQKRPVLPIDPVFDCVPPESSISQNGFTALGLNESHVFADKCNADFLGILKRSLVGEEEET